MPKYPKDPLTHASPPERPQPKIDLPSDIRPTASNSPATASPATLDQSHLTSAAPSPVPRSPVSESRRSLTRQSPFVPGARSQMPLGSEFGMVVDLLSPSPPFGGPPPRPSPTVLNLALESPRCQPATCLAPHSRWPWSTPSPSPCNAPLNGPARTPPPPGHAHSFRPLGRGQTICARRCPPPTCGRANPPPAWGHSSTASPARQRSRLPSASPA